METSNETKKMDIKTKLSEEISLSKNVINDKKAREISQKEEFLLFKGICAGICAFSMFLLLSFNSRFLNFPDNKYLIRLFIISLLLLIIVHYLTIREQHLQNKKQTKGAKNENCN